MIFFLTTGSIMVISIFLIYRLCRFFHIDMKCSSLLLCAVLAFIVNGAAILMSPFLDKTHYLRLGLLVVVAAAFVTFYNERLLRREEAAAKNKLAADEPVEVLNASPAVTTNPDKENPAANDETALADKLNQAQAVDSDKNIAIAIEPTSALTEQVPAEQAEKPAKETSTDVEAEAISIPAASPATEPPALTEASTADALIAAAPEPEPAADKIPAPAKTDTIDTLPETKPTATEPPAVTETSTTDALIAAAPEPEPAADKAPAPAKTDTIDTLPETKPTAAEPPALTEASTTDALIPAAPEPEPAAAEPPAVTETSTTDELIAAAPEPEPAADKIPAPAETDTIDTLPETKPTATEPLNIATAVAKLETLDDLLDYAYDHRTSSPKAAICAYRRAIEQYPNDDYMPFLIIELGNIYKNQADYRSTISIYAKALNMPIIAQNDATRQEFVKNLRYLGIVQDILSKHNALSTPFAEIPAPIMQEIEQVFQERLAESS